ncbi:hypothetical protein ACJW31_10G088600 [Castanea mollissima]
MIFAVLSLAYLSVIMTKIIEILEEINNKNLASHTSGDIRMLLIKK